jgi:hypothetical protein
MSAHAQLFGENSAPVSPVYQSEAARAIVQEMTRRRAIPRAKRRHHTVAGAAISPTDDAETVTTPIPSRFFKILSPNSSLLVEIS